MNRTLLTDALIRQYHLDPRAVRDIAQVEGGLTHHPNDIGDLALGGSYGPFQLFVHGALPNTIRQLPPQQREQWAWSLQGIRYALSQIQRVAAGLQGKSAISAISRDFERPANPQKEISRASALYGGSGDTSSGLPQRSAFPEGLGSLTPQMSHSNIGKSSRASLALALASGKDIYSLIPQLKAVQQERQIPGLSPLPAALGSQPPVNTLPYTGQKLNLAELFYDPLGGYKMGQSIGAIGGHQDHVHVAALNPQSELKAISLAEQLGLRVGENPYVGTVHPVHVSDSYHYKDYPGTYNGRKLGEAADVSGSAQAMAHYFKALARLAGYR